MIDEQRNAGAIERAARVRSLLEEARQTARHEVGGAEDPRAEALFETTAEVLGGLITACRHYEQGSEEAWRGGPADGRPGASREGAASCAARRRRR